MIREVIERIFSDYYRSSQEEFTDHPFAHWVLHDLPAIFTTEIDAFPNILWVASVGKGRWADAPWIAAFDPLITETAQEGFYPVYLFNHSLDRVYLSLNQGMSRLKEELGTQAKEVMSHRASILRARVTPDYQERFDSNPIDLNATSTQSRLAFYEPGHAFGKQYFRGELPSQDELKADLVFMLNLYKKVIIEGGTQELETTGHAVAELGEEYRIEVSLEERRRLRLHFRVERNKKLAHLAKQAHGYSCQICGFNFMEVYGNLGRDYIEAHHLTPLNELPPNEPIHLSPRDDFAVLCSNCHRMIHRSGAPSGFDEFRNLFNKQNQ
jgi:5-methylcytosine-specific restriction protein A